MKRLFLILSLTASVCMAQSPTPPPGYQAFTVYVMLPSPTPSPTPSPSPTPTPIQFPHTLMLVIDGHGSVLTPGIQNPVKLGYGGKLTGWSMVCKPLGSVTLDVLLARGGNGLPADSVVGTGTKPSINDDYENFGTVSNWTGAWDDLEFGNAMAVNVISATNVQYVELTLIYQ